jgi:hypothetical protein
MQSNLVYFYTNKLDIFTSVSDTWTTERYNRVYNRTLKIFRGIDNRLDIQVRSADQKTFNLTPPPNLLEPSNPFKTVLVFNLISEDTKDLVLQKDFSEMDNTTGKVTITLTSNELLDISKGYYNYSIVKETRQDLDSTDYKVVSRLPLYIDSQYGTNGIVEVSGEVYGELDDSRVIDTFNYTNPLTQGEVAPPAWFVSEIIDAKPYTQPANVLHTFQFYSTNYDGSVVIQGSLDKQGGSPRESSWADIASVDLSMQAYKNISGKYNWFRIKHIPTGSSNTASFVISQNLSMSYSVSIYTAGLNYHVNDTITILGNKLGGEQSTNDLVITVTGVDNSGRISSVNWTGLSYPGVKTFVLSGNASSVGTIDKILYR